jgi:hypothetical protein
MYRATNRVERGEKGRVVVVISPDQFGTKWVMKSSTQNTAVVTHHFLNAESRGAADICAVRR